MSFAAILSDLDGVLVDSGPSVEAAYTEWAESHGIDPTTLVGKIHGVPSRDVVARAAPHLDVEAEAAALERREIAHGAGRVLPGAIELLTGAYGLPVAVVTSCTDALATARFSAAGLPRPHVLVTADRVRHGKPDPEG